MIHIGLIGGVVALILLKPLPFLSDDLSLLLSFLGHMTQVLSDLVH